MATGSAPRRADDPVLRPLRRAAGRSARAVGVAAVRGDDPRRRDLRPRRRRRQGPGLHALQGDRSAPEEERPAAGQHEDHPRGRGGSRLGQSRRLRQGAQGRSRRRRRRHFRLADVRPRHSVDLLRPARPRLLPDRSARHQERPALGLLRRRRRQPGVRAGAGHRPDEGPRRPHQDSRLLRRRAAAPGRGAGGVQEAAVQRDALPQGSRRAEAVRRDRLLDARAGLGAADVRGQRPARPASPGKAPRR